MSVFVETLGLKTNENVMVYFPNSLSAGLIYCSANVFKSPKGKKEGRVFVLNVCAGDTIMSEWHHTKDFKQNTQKFPISEYNSVEK